MLLTPHKHTAKCNELLKQKGLVAYVHIWMYVHMLYTTCTKDRSNVFSYCWWS